MTAKEFVEEIHRIAPSREMLQNKSAGFVEYYLKGFQIQPNNEEKIDIESKDAVIDLIFNYDVSDLLIQIISFMDKSKIVENDDFIYFGWREAFPLGIQKKTGEIVEVDWDSPDYIVSYGAKDQLLFLDALIELQKLNLKRLYGEINNNEREKVLKKIGIYAGGEKYNKFYQDL